MAVEKQLAEIGYLIDKNRREVIEIIIEMQISMEKNGHFPILKLGIRYLSYKKWRGFI